MVDLEKMMSISRMAQKVGVIESQIRQLCVRKEIPFTVFDRKRLLNIDDIDTIRAACVKRGYLAAEPTNAS